MEITRDHIKETIQKMLIAGKQMPQKDRIKFAKDPAAEQQIVLKQTVDLWWELFSKRHIGVELWDMATDKALMIGGVTKLDVATVNPALMEYALNKAEEEHILNLRAKAEQEKQQKVRYVDANTHINVGHWWKVHCQLHKRPFLELSDYPFEAVRKRLPADKYPDDYIRKNLLALRIYYLFADHAKRDAKEMPIKLEMGKDGYLRIAQVV